jgi:uncharacterized Zn-binding protein involved in type VI secretion
MIRFNIMLGDKTTAGGTVISVKNTNVRWHNSYLVLEGDLVACPACQSQGHIVCTGPRQNCTYYGRRDALSGDLCFCKCDPKPKLINSHTDMCHVISQEELISQGYAKHPIQDNFIDELGKHDEKTLFTSTAHSVKLAGTPFFIETTDGRQIRGTLDEQGELPRIATQGLGSYKIFWGDEALSKG